MCPIISKNSDILIKMSADVFIDEVKLYKLLCVLGSSAFPTQLNDSYKLRSF